MLFRALIASVTACLCMSESNLRGTGLCQPDWTRVINRFNPSYYDMAKMYNKQVVSYPLYIYQPTTVEDVQETICWIKQLNLRIVVRGGGRGFSGSGTCDNDCVMLDMTRMNNIDFDESNHTLTVGAGVRARDITNILLQESLTLTLGVCGPVGICGLTLGGGYGYLSHSRGLTLDNLLSVQVVLANSSIVSANTTNNSDLFWALRGAGHLSYGVVTALTFRTLPIGPLSLFQYLVYNVNHSNVGQALELWQTLSQKLPEEGIFTKFVLSSSLKGSKKHHHVVFIFNSTLEIARDVIRSSNLLSVATEAPCEDPLTKLPTSCTDLTWSDLLLLTSSCGYEPHIQFIGASNYAETVLNTSSVELLINSFDSLTHSACDGDHVVVNIDRFNGAISQVPSNATAFVHRNKMFLYGTVVVYSNGRAHSMCKEWLHKFRDDLASVTSYDGYVNYEDYTLPHWENSYYGSNYEKLTVIKKQYDPHNLFRFQQSIRVA